MEPKILSENIEYKGNFSNIVLSKIELPNKRIVKWDFIDFVDDSVAIVPVDNENNIFLSKEWRNAWRKYVISIPVGHVKKNGEKENLKQARNELREEIGFDAKKIGKLVTTLHGLKIKHKIHIYLATGLFKSSKKADEGEIVEVVKMPIKKAYESFLSGKIETTGYTILGIILAMKKLKVK